MCCWDILRRYVKGLMTDAGLDVRDDGMGNIFGRWHGTDPQAGRLQAPSASSMQHQLCRHHYGK